MGIPSGSIPDGSAQNIFPQDPMGIQDPQASPETAPAGKDGKALNSPLAGDSMSQAVAGGEIQTQEADQPKLPEPGADETIAEFAAEEMGASETDTDKQKKAAQQRKNAEGSAAQKGMGGMSLQQFEQAAQNSADQIYDGFVETLPEDVGEAVTAFDEAAAQGMDEEDMQMELDDQLSKLDMSLSELRFVVSYGKLIAKVLALVSQMKGMMGLAQSEMTAEKYERELENYKGEMVVVKEEIKDRQELREKIRELEREMGMKVDAILAMASVLMAFFPFLAPMLSLVIANAALMKKHGPGNDLGSQMAKMFGGKEEDSWIGQMVFGILTAIMPPFGPNLAFLSIPVFVNAAKDKEYFEVKDSSPRDAREELGNYMHSTQVRIHQIHRALQEMLELEEDTGELIAMINQLLAMLYQILVSLRQEGKSATGMIGANTGSNGGSNPSTMVGITGENTQTTTEATGKADSSSREDSAIQIGQTAQEVSEMPQQAILDKLNERLASLEEFVNLLLENPEEAPNYRDLLLDEIRTYVGAITGAVQHFVSIREEDRLPGMDEALLNNTLQFFYTIFPEWPQAPEELVNNLNDYIEGQEENGEGMAKVAMQAGQSTGYLPEPSSEGSRRRENNQQHFIG